MERSDILVIGGGIAGLSAAARLAERARVTVVEREAMIGTHSSGRSATFYHFGLGNRPVRALTAASRGFFEAPPAEVNPEPLCRATPALFIATDEMRPELDALEADMRLFTDTVERIGAAGAEALVPVLRTGEGGIVDAVVDHGGRRLDADRLLHGFARKLRARGGRIVTDAELTALTFEGGLWRATTSAGSFAAPVVVNAAGAWADAVAETAGVPPLGLQPLRRTIIMFDPPAGVDAADWPFTKTATDQFYMLPEAGRLLASPVDEVPDEPCDAQPEDYDLALAAWRVEEFTTMSVPRIAHRWAGLRTFAADRVPVAGFAPGHDGFFWLAGQGGFGLQTSPAMADAAGALLEGSAWPEALAGYGVSPATLAPERLG